MEKQTTQIKSQCERCGVASEKGKHSKLIPFLKSYCDGNRHTPRLQHAFIYLHILIISLPWCDSSPSCWCIFHYTYLIMERELQSQLFRLGVQKIVKKTQSHESANRLTKSCAGELSSWHEIWLTSGTEWHGLLSCPFFSIFSQN